MADSGAVQRRMWLLRRLKTWQLVLLLILSLFVSATFLRLNNVGMIERRDAVEAADTSGDQDATSDALFDLQRYSAAHMNAASGDVYLVETYNRDVAAIAKAAREQNSSQNSSILKKADAACRKRFSGEGMAYVLCVQEEQAKYPASDNPDDTITFPDPALYHHSFISPVWTPDFAGWSVVISVALALAVVVRVLYWWILRLLLRRQYRSV